MIDNKLQILTNKIINNAYAITEAEASSLIEADLHELMFCANRIRKHFKGDKVHFCSIINARSGNCPENCKFCAQSGHYKTGVVTFPFVTPEQVTESAISAANVKADHFGVVISGKCIKTEKETAEICSLLEAVPQDKITSCASLGELNQEFASKLKKMGIVRYHHNIETSERFFPQVCTTHTYADRVKTLKIAKEAGFELCCGGIFGLGEEWSDRLDMAVALREYGVSSVPLNFLMPIKGTPFENNKLLSPLEILRIIAVFRFILPDKEIKVAGGRPSLRDLQSWIFFAGASGMMIGNYLTAIGRDSKADLQMMSDLEIEASTVN